MQVYNYAQFVDGQERAQRVLVHSSNRKEADRRALELAGMFQRPDSIVRVEFINNDPCVEGTGCFYCWPAKRFGA